jgi:hypothetical protein
LGCRAAAAAVDCDLQGLKKQPECGTTAAPAMAGSHLQVTAKYLQTNFEGLPSRQNQVVGSQTHDCYQQPTCNNLNQILHTCTCQCCPVTKTQLRTGMKVLKKMRPYVSMRTT